MIIAKGHKTITDSTFSDPASFSTEHEKVGCLCFDLSGAAALAWERSNIKSMTAA